MIEYQRIFWSGQYLAPDSDDPGIEPDSGHLEGTITFVPVWDSAAYGLLSDAARATHVRPFPFEVHEGHLVSSDDGEHVVGVKVPASIGGHPLAWVARFDLSAGGESITVRELRFSSNPGGEVHLHNIIPPESIYPQLPQDIIKGDSVTDIYTQGQYVVFIVGDPPRTQQYVMEFPGTDEAVAAAEQAVRDMELIRDNAEDQIHQVRDSAESAINQTRDDALSGIATEVETVETAREDTLEYRDTALEHRNAAKDSADQADRRAGAAADSAKEALDSEEAAGTHETNVEFMQNITLQAMEDFEVKWEAQEAYLDALLTHWQAKFSEDLLAFEDLNTQSRSGLNSLGDEREESIDTLADQREDAINILGNDREESIGTLADQREQDLETASSGYEQSLSELSTGREQSLNDLGDQREGSFTELADQREAQYADDVSGFETIYGDATDDFNQKVSAWETQYQQDLAQFQNLRSDMSDIATDVGIEVAKIDGVLDEVSGALDIVRAHRWVPQGEWDEFEDYEAGDVVAHDGGSYYAQTDISAGNPPPGGDWVMLGQGGITDAAELSGRLGPGVDATDAMVNLARDFPGLPSDLMTPQLGAVLGYLLLSLESSIEAPRITGALTEQVDASAAMADLNLSGFGGPPSLVMSVGDWLATLYASMVLDIPGELDNKSDIGHTHTISDVSGLQDALDNAGSNDAADLTGALTDQVDANAAMVTGSMEGIGAETLPLSEWMAILIALQVNVYSPGYYLDQSLSGKSDVGHTHSPAEVGLGEVDNTADADKPVSTAQQAAIDAKVQLVSEFPSSPESGVLYLKAED